MKIDFNNWNGIDAEVFFLHFASLCWSSSDIPDVGLDSDFAFGARLRDSSLIVPFGQDGISSFNCRQIECSALRLMCALWLPFPSFFLNTQIGPAR
jgi:hypothetical protein